MTRLHETTAPSEYSASALAAALAARAEQVCRRYLPRGRKQGRYAYLAGAGIGEERRGPLFRSCEPGRNDALGDRAMSRLGALRMIKRRARRAGLPVEICAHSFRGTGITEYLRNGGDLEVAARIAGHESTRTTQLYNRLAEEISLDEIERIHI